MDPSKTFDRNEHERAASASVTATEDAIVAASGVPPMRTVAEQLHYDSLSPVDKNADNEKRQAAARAKALALLPKRTEGEQQAYDAMSPADRTSDDERRLAAAKRAAVETPEGRAARQSHEQAMKQSPKQLLHDHAVAHQIQPPPESPKR